MKGNCIGDESFFCSPQLQLWATEETFIANTISTLLHFILRSYRPDGQITALQLPANSNQFYVVRYPKGHPEQFHYLSTALSKEELFHKFFHYFVAKPPHLKRCVSCRQQLDSLCIQTDIVCILQFWIIWRSQVKDKSVKARVAFCLNDLCLPSWLAYNPKSVSTLYVNCIENIVGQNTQAISWFGMDSCCRWRGSEAKDAKHEMETGDNSLLGRSVMEWKATSWWTIVYFLCC
jgi:hypothetical protein